MSATPSTARPAADFSFALPVEGRATAISKLEKQIFELEMRQEALIKEAEAAGHPVMRRPDVRGDVVLGVVGD